MTSREYARLLTRIAASFAKPYPASLKDSESKVAWRLKTVIDDVTAEFSDYITPTPSTGD